MGPQYSPSNITTAVMCGLAVWTIICRFRFPPDSNWPMIFYLLVVIYHLWFPGRLNQFVVYAGVLSTLFLRFEFMGGPFMKFVRAVDVGVLGFVAFQFASAVAT